MTESGVGQSIVRERICLDQIQSSFEKQSIDLKDKIIELQKSQKLLKQSIIETDVGLKSPNMKYRESILHQSYKRQKLQFQAFSQNFKNLAQQQRRPYETMFRKLKQKVNEHSEQIRLVIQEPEQYKKKLQSVRQVWFENEETQQEEWKFLLRGFLGILGGFLCHVMIGAINRWTMINPYITSFYKITTDPNLQIKKNAFVGPLSMFCTGLTMKFGLKQSNKYSPIIILLISTIGMSISALASSFVDEFVEFILFNNVTYGMFAGMIFLTTMRQCHKYFPKYRLVCNSIILMGTGIGAVFFGVFNTSCMNPNHQKALDTGFYSGERAYIPEHYPICWRQMSVAILVIGAGAMLCFYPMVAYNRKEEQIKLQKGQVPDFENSCYTDEEALKSRVFWMLVLLVMCSSFGNYFMTANFKNFVKAQKDPIFKNDEYMLMVLLTGFLCSAFFGVFWGFTFRNIGFKYIYIIAICLNIVVFSCLLIIELNEVTYIILFATHFIVQGGWMVIFPNVCLLVFGDIIGESIYGVYYSCFALTSFCQYLVSSNIVDIAAFVKNNLTFFTAPQNNYKFPLYPAILLGIIGLLICAFSKFQGRWENSLKLLTFSCEQNNSI